MNTSLTQTFEFEGHPLHPIIHNGKVAFIGKELCDALGYKNSSAAMLKLPDHQKDKIAIRDSIGRSRKTPVVYEGGVYRLIFGSHLPNAETFTDLITDIILPTIRKTGSYTSQPTPILQLPEKATGKQAIEILQHLETLVKEGQFHEEVPAYKHENLEYALRKAQGYFTGHTMFVSYTDEKEDEFGYLPKHEYPREPIES